MIRKKEIVKSKSLDSFHPSLCIPSIEEQLKALPPSRALVEFYRNRLAYYEKEFTHMTKQVDRCKRICDGYGEIRNELKHGNDHVFKLQKALSDMQVYLHRERSQVLSLNLKNDVLKIQMAKERKIINFLLLQCGTTEDQVTHLINQGKADCLRKRQAIQTKDEYKIPMTGSEKDLEIMTLQLSSLEDQLRDLTTTSQDEIYSLHKDRELLQMEKEKEYQRLQDQISVLTDKLSTAHANICDLTSELIALKRNFAKKEENWILEKEKERKRKNPRGDVNALPEKYEFQSKSQMDNMLKVFKDNLQHKEDVIRLYKDKCVSLENELLGVNNSRDQSTEMLQKQVEKVNKQLANMKDKYQKLHQKRWFEAEGFRSDVRIMKGRFLELERKLSLCARSHNRNTIERREEIITAKELKCAAKCLDKELCQLKKEMTELGLIKQTSWI